MDLKEVEGLFKHICNHIETPGYRYFIKQFVKDYKYDTTRNSYTYWIKHNRDENIRDLFAAVIATAWYTIHYNCSEGKINLSISNPNRCELNFTMLYSRSNTSRLLSDYYTTGFKELLTLMANRFSSYTTSIILSIEVEPVHIKSNSAALRHGEGFDEYEILQAITNMEREMRKMSDFPSAAALFNLCAPAISDAMRGKIPVMLGTPDKHSKDNKPKTINADISENDVSIQIVPIIKL